MTNAQAHEIQTLVNGGMPLKQAFATVLANQEYAR
jgi:hypothetical protein